MSALVLFAHEGLEESHGVGIRSVLDHGGLVAYPTESFYGLGVSPWSDVGLGRLHAFKRERAGKPVPLVLADANRTDLVARLRPAGFEQLADRFWPGPLTLVLPARSDLSPLITAGLGTVGVRVPAHGVARAIASLGGGAVTSTSANRSGEAPPCSTGEIVPSDEIGIIVDGGRTPGGAPSTIIDLCSWPPLLVRVGAVGRDDIELLLGVTLG